MKDLKNIEVTEIVTLQYEVSKNCGTDCADPNSGSSNCRCEDF